MKWSKVQTELSRPRISTQLQFVVVVLTLNRIIKAVVTRQAPVTLELRNTAGKKHKHIEGGTCIYHS